MMGLPEYLEDESEDYKLPRGSSNEYQTFIDKCLKQDPDERPTIQQLLDDEFLQGA